MLVIGKYKKYIYASVFAVIIAISAQTVSASVTQPKSIKINAHKAIASEQILTNNIDELESGSTMNLVVSMQDQDMDGKLVSSRILVGQ